MEKYNIVILDAYSVNPGDLSWDSFKQLGCLKIFDRTLPEEIIERSKDADIILTNKVKLNRDHFSKLPKLKYIGIMATGYDIIDTTAAAEKGIVVTNVPAYSTNHVAQMVFSHLLNITDNVAHYANENRHGRWTNNPDFCYWDSTTHELTGKTMGIIGLGNIGAKVAQIASAFGMKVIALTSKSQEELPGGCKKVEEQELFQQSDVITLHCPLTDYTRNLIRKETIELMKSSAIVINTGRGPLVNDEDMAQALTEKRIKAYATDVMTPEPPLSSNPLLNLEKAFITPHIAWASIEARERMMTILQENINAFIQGNPKNVVNGK